MSSLTPGEQDALAERYRANFVRELSPDDWYKCYSDPKLSDFNGPMYDAFRRAKISDEKLKPFLQTEIFDRFVWLLWLKAAGEDVPKEVNYNCNNPRPAAAAVRKTAVRLVGQGLTKILAGALQVLGGSDVAFLADRFVREVVDDGPASPHRTDEEIDAIARQGLATGKSIVASYLASEDAVTFDTDVPRMKAQKLALAAAAVVAKREWPSAFFLAMANISAGQSGRFELLHYYGSESHPDVKAWNGMTHYERGEAVRRLYIEMMRAHSDIAAGKLSLEEYAADKQQSLRLDFNRFVGESFGLDTLRHYHDAERNDSSQALPGYSADDIRVAAYVYTAALRVITFVSM